MNAKKTIEIEVFMGYSLLTTAFALPQDGKIIAINPDKEAFEKGLPYIKKANVENKIEFIHSKALPILDKLLEEYILETSVYPREHEELWRLRDVSTQQYFGFMTTPLEEGQLLSLLLKLMKAKKAIEIGVFMGYSLLTTALAFPEDGKFNLDVSSFGEMIPIDPDKEAFEKGLPYIRKANVERKIDFIHSKVLPILDNLLEEGSDEEGAFDFAFVDADKTSYGEYHELLMRLTRAGGFIVYDNTLWFKNGGPHQEKHVFTLWYSLSCILRKDLINCIRSKEEYLTLLDKKSPNVKRIVSSSSGHISWLWKIVDPIDACLAARRSAEALASRYV
ncbi:Flavonoid 3',5'-methyltransferase [Acorus calamus]|uniref:Flavonoid 3',5'-methyltransferase n=1 Tax=Acorus calamus TaxID=4465 RepID=A0AAV9DYK0_ACOCL|nr:Flavonoid 3',5'-methyltransferase [Acorus calamus]